MCCQWLARCQARNPLLPLLFALSGCRLRLVALASQRFISSILDEAVNVHKRRRLAPAAQLRADGHNPRDKRIVLSTEELAEALREV